MRALGLGVLRPLASAGSRAAAATLSPFGDLVGAAANSALDRALSSEEAARLVDALFDSGLLERFLERLLASDGLWRLVEQVASSPAVTAAISQQGLGFVDQLGDEVRSRSHRADDWVERAARRLVHRQSNAHPTEPDAST